MPKRIYFSNISGVFILKINTLVNVLFANQYNFDKKIIDRFGPNGFGSVTRAFSWCVCQFQTGYIFNYAFYIVFALVSYITFILIKYLQSVGA